jgi:ABC-type oligopeptide transport system substrate-binding subunit
MERNPKKNKKAKLTKPKKTKPGKPKKRAREDLESEGRSAKRSRIEQVKSPSQANIEKTLPAIPISGPSKSRPNKVAGSKKTKNKEIITPYSSYRGAM